MVGKIVFRELFAGVGGPPGRSLGLFAILNLGLIEALNNGMMDAEDAIRELYHADNCLYISKDLKNKLAHEIMGRGVQLADLFDALPAGQAHREFLRELATMRALCLKMLEGHRSVA